MTLDLCDYEKKTRKAIQRFWSERNLSGVRAGKNMDGFVDLISKLVRSNGLPNAQIHLDKAVLTLPGYFRSTKLWDMLVMLS